MIDKYTLLVHIILFQW